MKKFLTANRSCDECREFLTTKDRLNVSQLTEKKTYTVSSMTFASEPVFNLLKVAESAILDIGSNIIKTKCMIPRLVKETKSGSKEMLFPQCHDIIVGKLVYKYCKNPFHAQTVITQTEPRVTYRVICEFTLVYSFLREIN